MLAEDSTQPEGQWRVKLQKDQKSFTHNHPPVKENFAFAQYRRATREALPEERLKEIWAASQGPNHALQMVRAEFPTVQMTRQDIKNQFMAYHRQELGFDTKTGLLLKELEWEKYWFR